MSMQINKNALTNNNIPPNLFMKILRYTLSYSHKEYNLRMLRENRRKSIQILSYQLPPNH
ncbi:hypothetical protein HZS_7131 [Henneguya salminicola]|nr:hypothetical protein HZS_7131 [Henneguya salminicola]